MPDMREVAVLKATARLDVLSDDYSCGKPSMEDVYGYARDILSQIEIETGHRLTIETDENGITYI